MTIKRKVGTIGRNEVLDLMVEIFGLTGGIYNGSKFQMVNGRPEEILNEIEKIVDSRWVRQFGYGQQYNQLFQLIEKLEFLNRLEAREFTEK